MRDVALVLPFRRVGVSRMCGAWTVSTYERSNSLRSLHGHRQQHAEASAELAERTRRFSLSDRTTLGKQPYLYAFRQRTQLMANAYGVCGCCHTYIDLSESLERRVTLYFFVTDKRGITEGERKRVRRGIQRDRLEGIQSDEREKVCR